jgi:hypothetical protein
MTGFKINWIAGDAGHVAAHSQVGRKLNEHLSVFDYGAAGGGVVDDTAAIQAAINSGKCYLAGGTFKITATLHVPSYCIFDGEGATINYTGAGNAIDFIGSVGSEILYPEIRNLTLVGAGNGIGIYGELFGRCKLKNIFLSNFGTNGIKLINGWAPLLDYCIISNIAGDGIHLESGANHRMHLPVISNCIVNYATGRGLYCYQSGISSGVLIAGSTFENSGIGILLDGGYSHLIDHPYFEANTTSDIQVGATLPTYSTSIISPFCYDWNIPKTCIGINLVNHIDTVIQTPVLNGLLTGIQIDLTGSNANVSIRRSAVALCTNEMLVAGTPTLCDGLNIDY